MAEPLTTAELKAHLRKTTTDEDTLIATYGVAAREWCEEYTGHILNQREVTDSFSAWGDYLTLRYQPITVDDPTPTLTVEYTDDEGDFIEYAERVVRDFKYPWTVHSPYGFSFPSLGGPATIKVTGRTRRTITGARFEVTTTASVPGSDHRPACKGDNSRTSCMYCAT